MTPWTVGFSVPRLFCPWNSPVKNAGVDCHFRLQGIFPTQGSNLSLLRLLHWSLAGGFSTTAPLGSPLGNGAQWGKADKNGPGKPQAPTRGEGSSLAKMQDFHRTFLFSLCISSSQWMAPGLGGQSMGLLEAEW